MVKGDLQVETERGAFLEEMEFLESSGLKGKWDLEGCLEHLAHQGQMGLTDRREHVETLAPQVQQDLLALRLVSE